MAISIVNQKKIFFPGLDGIRAIAAFLVVISHIESQKIDSGITKLKTIDFVPLGPIGVTIFFVLSGFLITYLLLSEQALASTISYKNFYIRRILRIWPLYFLVLISGYLIYPEFTSSWGFWLGVFLLPNVAFIFNLYPSEIDPIWSIGVEEQFYLFHPQLLRIKNPAKLFNVLLSIIILITLLKLTLVFLPKYYCATVIRDFLYISRYDNMLIGALFAIILFNSTMKRIKYRIPLDFVQNKSINILITVILISYLITSLLIGLQPIHQLIALCCGFIIINICNGNTGKWLNNMILNFLGSISYGVYLLHKFAIIVALFIMNKMYDGTNPYIINILLYMLTIVSTIAIASATYYLFERYFLRLKERFAKITK